MFITIVTMTLARTRLVLIGKVGENKKLVSPFYFFLILHIIDIICYTRDTYQYKKNY